ncbi:MAG: hypothetical protein JSR58_07990 [Verrucomicrobia bacterium]|nr:hypothetical protein [Verrucomicrobiota bacterium]
MFNLNATASIVNNSGVIPGFSSAYSAPEINSLKHQRRFHELTRRLPAQELENLNKQLTRVTEKDIQTLLQALQMGNWSAPLFHQSHYPFVALEAFKRGSIEEESFGTVMLYWVNCHDFGTNEIQTIPLFNTNGTVNEDAEKLIESTLYATGVSPFPKLPAIPKTHAYLDKKQLRELILGLKNSPASERFIFVRKKDYPTGNIGDSIYASGLNIFHRIPGGCMIPSISLVRDFYQMKFGKEAAKINLLLGPSSTLDIENSHRLGMRDVALHFPGTTLPDEADNQNAPGYLFTLHDLLFHVYLVSRIPFEHAQRFMKVVERVREYIDIRQKHNLDARLEEQYAALLIDMDFQDYREENMALEGYRLPHERKMENVFWSTLATYVGDSMQIIKASENLPTNTELPLIETQEERNLLDVVAATLPRNKEYSQQMEEELSFLKRFNPHIEMEKSHLFYLLKKWKSLS